MKFAAKVAVGILAGIGIAECCLIAQSGFEKFVRSETRAFVRDEFRAELDDPNSQTNLDISPLRNRVERLEENDEHNHSVYVFANRLRDRVSNIEKKRWVKRPDWWCCGQLREGEPEIDSEWIGLYPAKGPQEPLPPVPPQPHDEVESHKIPEV
jgi:hypothetical protein